MAGTSFHEARLVVRPVARADVSSLAGPAEGCAGSERGARCDCRKQNNSIGSMPAIITEISPPAEGVPKLDSRRASKASRPGFEASAADSLQPNFLVRWAFYVSVFSIPFALLYL